MVDEPARHERRTHVGSLTTGPRPPHGSTPDRDYGELGLLVIAQFGAFVAVAIATFPFLTKDLELEPGLAPILVALAAAWPVLLAGVALAARHRSVAWRDSVDARQVRLTDLGAIVLGVLLQVGVGVAYFLAGVDEDDVSGPARGLTERAGSVGVGFFVLAVFVVVGAPVVEELFYRGAVLNGIRRALGAPNLTASFDRVTVIAIAVSSVWFGAIHGQLLQLPALIAVGVVCAIARVRTGRLATAIFLHAGFNLTSIVSLGIQLAKK